MGGIDVEDVKDTDKVCVFGLLSLDEAGQIIGECKRIIVLDAIGGNVSASDLLALEDNSRKEAHGFFLNHERCLDYRIYFIPSVMVIVNARKVQVVQVVYQNLPDVQDLMRIIRPCLIHLYI